MSKPRTSTTTRRRAPAGRPPKLTPEVHDRIVIGVKAGSFLKVAAAAAGVGESTFRRWMSDQRKPYRDLQAAVRQAEAEFEARTTALVWREVSDHPDMGLKLLERRFPARWGRARGLGSADGPNPDALDDPDKASGDPFLRQVFALSEAWQMPILKMIFAAKRGRTPREFFEGPKGVSPSLKEESDPREWWDIGQDAEIDEETPPGNG